jgi:hypothetical protein
MYAYNQYINKFIYSIKYIRKSETPVKLLHVSAPSCQHQGIILNKDV